MGQIKRVAVIGAGIMGHGIAQNFARYGYETMLYDVDQQILEKARGNIGLSLKTFVEAGVLEADSADRTLSRITLTTRLDEAVEHADFITEAAPEDFELKSKIFKEMDLLTQENVILASNTSMLSMSEFGEGVQNRKNLIITHWFNPPHIVPVVEIVMTAHTSEETYLKTRHLLSEIGKEPVKVRKEIPGFLINRIQTAMFREVLSLVEQGIASPEDVDRAIKGSFGLRLGVIGVLQTMDMAGLDLMYKGTKYLYPHIDRSLEPQQVLRDKVLAGDLGAKAGKGFFTYDEAAESDGKESKLKNRDKQLLKIIQLLKE